jgi:acyl-CoA synthetase (AMP-forming)/AMP-acid ligase II
MSTLVDLLRYRATTSPGAIAFTFLQDGGSGDESLTYGELDRRARALAVRLTRRGAFGERIVLLYPPGLPYISAFFGCLYAGALPVPAYPPDPAVRRTFPRVQRIVEDSRAVIALTTPLLLGAAAQVIGQIPGLADLHWMTEPEDAVDPQRYSVDCDDWQRPAIDEDSLAFLQYTSGSTGSPRGVALSHGNLMHNERLIEHGFGHDRSSIVVGWLPLYHDMGLIGNVLQPIYVGVPCVLMSPRSFLRRPLRWLQTISRHRATTSGAPNFAYDLCVRKFDPQDMAGVDLGSWDLAFCGAEPVRAETLDRFTTTFEPFGFRREAFYPCYGLAEATLIVTGGRKQEPPVVVSPASDGGRGSLVGCGKALLDERVIVVDPDRRVECREGEEGEIWVSGPGVAKGYWGQEEMTRETFGAQLASGDGPFLRTGDLGVLRNGELFITGRRKDLIIIRGRNLYPHDIERTVESCAPQLRPGCGAVFGVEIEQEERLVVVQEADLRDRTDPKVLLETIRQTVTDHYDVAPAAVVLLRRGTIAKTSSGKIQRHACRLAFEAGSLDVVANLGYLPAPRAVPGEPPRST